MKAFDSLGDRHRAFIAAQKMFFVGTAPLSAEGHVNVSPKGLDSFVVLDASRVAYVDLGGSGIETHAHVQENGRLCVMFCAFEGDPLILRLYGQARAHAYGSPGFDALLPAFPNVDVPVRGIIDLRLDRVQESCGWGVPLYAYKGDRSHLPTHNAKRDQEAFFERRLQTNAKSLDGLPGLTRP